MEKYTKAWIKEYNKTWYYKITLRRGMTPKKLVSGKPIYIFGIRTGLWLWKIAKPTYKWRILDNKTTTV